MIFVEALLVFALIAIIWMLVMLVIFRKGNKAKIKGVTLMLLAFVAVGAAIFAVGHFLEWHEQNEFCNAFCHAMDPQYESYTEPENNAYMEAHHENDVTCAQCHSGPGFEGQFNSYLAVPNEVWGEYIGGYDPDDLGGHVPNENCMKGCHEEAGIDWKFEAPMPAGEGYSVVDGEVVWLTMEIYHPYTMNGTDLKLLEDSGSCKDCHDPRANSFGLTAETCETCHDIGHEELEEHGEATCSMVTCHDDGSDPPTVPTFRGHAEVGEHCMVCHKQAHPDEAIVPYSVTNSLGVTFEVDSEFCGDCHHDTYDKFELGDTHLFTGCEGCHETHKTYEDCLSCHETSRVPDHGITDPHDDCTECHDPHDPQGKSPHPGGGRSQSDYMSTYAPNSYDWVKRGHHPTPATCSDCHVSPGIVRYPVAAQSLMNASGQDCSGSCHEWIDTTTTGNPYTLLISSNEFSEHEDLFEEDDDEEQGGCAGRCHQSDPGNPVLDGSGHGTITNCLNSDCHGGDFPGDIHDDHKDALEDDHWIGTTRPLDITCDKVCHKGLDDDFEPINGGCYACHQSGHVPRIVDTSPCIGCHRSNKGG